MLAHRLAGDQHTAAFTAQPGNVVSDAKFTANVPFSFTTTKTEHDGSQDEMREGLHQDQSDD